MMKSFVQCAVLVTLCLFVFVASEPEDENDNQSYQDALPKSHIAENHPVNDIITARQNDDPVCSVKADIGLIIDTSTSLWQHYDKEKLFANSLAEAFGIDQTDGARISVITFSNYAQLTIKFDEYNDIDMFKAAVNKIPLFGQMTRLDTALRTAQRKMFVPENGMRSGTPKLLVLMTDGKQTKYPGYEDPAIVVRELRQAGIKVLVVAMGGASMSDKQVAYLAGGSENAFKARGFKQLVSAGFIKAVRDKACDNVNPAPVPTKPPVPADKCPDIDADFQGNDLKLVLDVADWKACASNCKANGACAAFSYVTTTRCCYLKTGNTNRVVKTGVISGSSNCPVTVTVDGDECVFPFKYEGKEYKTCTTVNNRNTLWCSTTYDYVGKYGNCKLDTI